jgi:hypothetical protein
MMGVMDTTDKDLPADIEHALNLLLDSIAGTPYYVSLEDSKEDAGYKAYMPYPSHSPIND